MSRKEMTNRVETIFGHLSPEQTNVRFAQTSGLQTQVTPSGPYEFSIDNNILTPEQRQFYEENGFIIIKKCVPKDKISNYRERFRQICDGEVHVPGLTVMKDVAFAKSKAGEKGERVITKIQDFQYDDDLFDYCALPEVVKYVTAFTGPNIMAMHTMLINKPPDPGTKSSRHPMHQDLHYFPFRPANKIVCSWTAMERVHRDNGCLVVVPGTHKGELLEHEYPEWGGAVNKLYHGVKGYNPSMERTWVEMDEGDTVFFHPILLHGSGTNRTKGFRKAISCHYAASECEYIDLKGTIQEQVVEETMDVVEKKLGSEVRKNMEYKDMYKMKARLVSGKVINM